MSSSISHSQKNIDRLTLIIEIQAISNYCAAIAC
jgi:hypothetical protein